MSTDYIKMYQKIFKIMGDLTPLKADCGKVCGGACCKGDRFTGMHLFPFEESELPKKEAENGVCLVVCDGSCDRGKRPLACRIFPFFPTVDEKGKVYVEPDFRGARLCPLATHFDEIIFDPKFFKALKKVGKILAKDEVCRKFLEDNTKEIDIYRAFLE